MDGSDNVEHCGVSEKSLNDFKRELYEESQKIREEEEKRGLEAIAARNEGKIPPPRCFYKDGELYLFMYGGRHIKLGPWHYLGFPLK